MDIGKLIYYNDLRMKAALKFGLLAGALVVCAFAILGTQSRAQQLTNPDRPPSENRSIDGAFNATVAINSPSARMRDKVVLFVTNRRIDPYAEQRAKIARKLLKYEDLFLNKLDVPVSFGAATISYPTNRMAGEQNYGRDSVRQNPLYHFSVVDHEIVNSPEAFHRLISRLYPHDKDDSLLYVHGLDHTFSEAAERFAQIAVDLEYKGLPLFFSWPSDAYRTGSIVGAYSSNAYINTLSISERSQKYAAIAIEELVNQNKPINAIAHSMGADIAVKAIMLRARPSHDNVETVTLTLDSRALILAAADISTSDFETNVRPIIARSVEATVVYCAHDRALDVSQQYNHSDQRLGYCTTPKLEMDGVEIVAVKGIISGFAQHSYYLDSPKDRKS